MPSSYSSWHPFFFSFYFVVNNRLDLADATPAAAALYKFLRTHQLFVYLFLFFLSSAFPPF
jgi:hypothetical protein